MTLTLMLGTALGAQGCGGGGDSSVFPGGDASTGSTATSTTGGTVGSTAGSGGSTGGTTGDGGAGSTGGTTASNEGGFGFIGGCTDGLKCNQVQCEGGATTTISGTVYDPAGKVPLYDVVVYVPNAPLQPLTDNGASCDQCGASVSGSPLVITLTDAKGQFVLNNAPVGTKIPLVMQVGKWRRQVTISTVTACTDNPADPNLTRLPRNQMEGDIPRIAVATGGADPFECLLRKVGLDDAEFTTAGGTGRVHLYHGGSWTATETDGGMDTHNAASQFAQTLNGGAAFAEATDLWGSSANLKAYDMLLMACEGTLNASTKPDMALSALYDFENAGGRVFASHWHRYWFSNGPAPVPSVGTWKDRIDPAMPGMTAIGTVDTSFPKGQALSDWLVNVKASTTPGQLPIKDSKHNLDSVNTMEAQQWITMPNPYAMNQTAIEYMTFNTPIGMPAAMQCGRVVYSDLHVSSGDVTGQPFPSGCVTSDLSPQEKALEFMLFDLSSCILPDTMKPIPPPAR
jgi:hypothetical protein